MQEHELLDGKNTPSHDLFRWISIDAAGATPAIAAAILGKKAIIS